MVGKYVTTSRNLPPRQTLITLDASGRSTQPQAAQPFVRNRFGGTSVLPNNSVFPESQTTTSYRSVGSPLGPKQDEYAALMSLPQRAVDYNPLDTGHTFSTERTYRLTSHPDYKKNFSNGAGFRGPLHLYEGPFSSDDFTFPSLPAFDAAYTGRRLIASAAPTVPSSNLLTAGAELLREGITSPLKALILSMQSRTGLLRAVGSEYLNIEFGWKPLIADVNDVMNSVIHMSSIINNYKKNSGQWVHRKRRIPIVSSVYSSTNNSRARLGLAGATLDGSNWEDLWQSTPSNSGSPVSITKQTEEEVWFSGEFSYYLNPGSDLSGKFERYSQLANQLLGLRLTPEVLWELAPWSWLVDYFVDLGTAVRLSSLFSNDGLVMKYGYLMRRTLQKVTVSSEFPPFYDGSRITVTNTLFRETKNRYRATPFGFGLNPSGFSARQWAILVALGLTRAPNALP